MPVGTISTGQSTHVLLCSPWGVGKGSSTTAFVTCASEMSTGEVLLRCFPSVTTAARHFISGNMGRDCSSLGTGCHLLLQHSREATGLLLPELFLWLLASLLPLPSKYPSTSMATSRLGGSNGSCVVLLRVKSAMLPGH